MRLMVASDLISLGDHTQLHCMYKAPGSSFLSDKSSLIIRIVRNLPQSFVIGLVSRARFLDENVAVAR